MFWLNFLSNPQKYEIWLCTEISNFEYQGDFNSCLLWIDTTFKSIHAIVKVFIFLMWKARSFDFLILSMRYPSWFESDFLWCFFLIPKKLSNGVRKLVLDKSNRLALFWQFKTAFSTRKRGTNMSSYRCVLHTFDQYEIVLLCSVFPFKSCAWWHNCRG